MAQLQQYFTLFFLASRLLKAFRHVMATIVSMPATLPASNGASDEGASELDASSMSASAYVPIDFTGAKCICFLCGFNSVDDSPLMESRTQSLGRGKIPWAKYRLVHITAEDGSVGSPICKRSYGKACAICRNVFNATELEEVHDTIPKYYIHACKAENSGDYRSFMSRHAIVVLLSGTPC